MGVNKRLTFRGQKRAVNCSTKGEFYMAEYKSPTLWKEVTVEIPSDVFPGLKLTELRGRREQTILFCGSKF